MREPGKLHPPRAQSSRFPRSRPRRRPRIWAERSVQVATRKALRSGPLSHGALEVWSVRVLLPVGIAPRDRGAGATRKALRSPKEHGLIVSPPAWRGAALQYGSSMGWQQAAPGNDPTPCFAHRVYTGRREQPAHRTATRRDIPGSRLLLTHRAATLQSGSPPAFGPLGTRLVCNPSVVLRHPALWRTGQDGITSKLSQPQPRKHVNSSILEPNASTISELLVHSAPFSTL